MLNVSTKTLPSSNKTLIKQVNSRKRKSKPEITFRSPSIPYTHKYICETYTRRQI